MQHHVDGSESHKPSSKPGSSQTGASWREVVVVRRICVMPLSSQRDLRGSAPMEGLFTQMVGKRAEGEERFTDNAEQHEKQKAREPENTNK